jgi:predicted kinase
VREQAGWLHPLWIARQKEGAVRECHGDLHMSNLVMLDGELTPFDCIEFEPALRWIDVASDLAFLTMDLKAHGRSDLAGRLLDSWLQHTGDFQGLRVLAFYEVYRAAVRAMAEASVLQDRGAHGVAPVQDYLALATGLAATPGGHGCLLITHGFSGSGKSTVALQLMRATGAVRIRSDVERKRLFGIDMLADSQAHGLDIYDERSNYRTFDRIESCARNALSAGYPVIVDAAFLRQSDRKRFREMAAELDLPFAILHCRAGEATLRARVTQRAGAGADPSEAGLQVLERQLSGHEPLDAGELSRTIEVMTDAPIDVAALVDRWHAFS